MAGNFLPHSFCSEVSKEEKKDPLRGEQPDLCWLVREQRERAWIFSKEVF